MKRIFFVFILGVLSFTPGTQAETGSPDGGDLLRSLEPSAIIEETRGPFPKPGELATKPFLILIQDIHAEPDAQLKIEKTLSALEDKLGPLHVLLEGGSGAVETQFFRTCPLPDIARDVLLKHLGEGELSGAEIRAASPSGWSSYEGMEDWPLYEEDRRMMREGSILFAKNTALFEAGDKIFAELKKKYFSPALREFGGKREAYEKGGSDALGYIDFLIEKGASGNASREYPVLSHLSAIKSSWTTELNSEAEKEKMVLIKTIEQKSRSTPKDTSDEALVGEARSLRIPSEEYRNLEKRSQWAVEMQAIKSTAFIQELKSLETEVADKLVRTLPEKVIWRSEKRFRLLKKLAQFQLSREEYEDVRSSKDTLGPQEIFQVLSRDFQEIPVQLTFEWEDWDPAPFKEFYELAEKREEEFLKKIQNSFRKGKAVVAVVGGFHSQGILEKIRKENVPHISLLPKTEKTPDTQLYFRLMLEGRSPYHSAPILRPAQILALATVLTPLSNPEDFRSLLNKTGEEIYDAIHFQRLEERPYEILNRWAAAVESSETNKKVRMEYESVLTRLYTRAVLAEPAVPLDTRHPDFFRRITQVNRIFGKLFLENGQKPLDDRKMKRFLDELKQEARNPSFNLTDLILLVYGSRWDLSYGDVAGRYRKFLRHEALPPGISAEEYQRLNRTIFGFAFPGYPTRPVGFLKIWDDYRGKTIQDFLADNKFQTFTGPETAFAVYLRLIPYSLDTPIEGVQKDFDSRGNLNLSEAIDSLVGKVPADEIHSTPDGYQFRIMKNPVIPADVERAYELVTAKLDELRREMENKYQSALIRDTAPRTFLDNLKALDLVSEKDRRVLFQLRALLKSVLGFEKEVDRLNVKRSALSASVHRLQEDPSSANLRLFRIAQKEVISLHADILSFAGGIRRQDIHFGDLNQAKIDQVRAQVQTLIPAVRIAESETGPEEFRKELLQWTGSSSNLDTLWKLVRSRNFELRISLTLLSDPSFKKRRYFPPAFISRSIARVPNIGMKNMDIPSISEEDYLAERKTERDTLYFVYEFIETLARLMEVGDINGYKIAERVVDGVLREEIEGHKFLTGMYDLFLPHKDEARERLDELMAGRGLDRAAIETDLRLGVNPRAPSVLLERINSEEAVAKLVRGGYDVTTGSIRLDDLIQHLASYLFVTLGFEFQYSKEYFQGEVRDFFVVFYSEFPWIHLRITPEEARGTLAPYAGKTYAEAVETEAVKLFEDWNKAEGRSLGEGRNNVDLTLAVERILDGGEISRETLLSLYAAARGGETAPFFTALEMLKTLSTAPDEVETLESVRKAFQLSPDSERPLQDLLRWHIERTRQARNSQVLNEFLAKGTRDPELLKTLPFARIVEGYAKKGERPGSVHFLPQAVPRSKVDLITIASLPQNNSRVYFYINQNDPLDQDQVKVGEMIGKIKPGELPIGVYSSLKKITLRKSRNETDLLRKLKAELARGNAKGWGAAIFDDQRPSLEKFPKAGKDTYLLLQASKDAERFDWLAGKIREIGFILPTLTSEESLKFRQDLAGYGVGFKETPKGFLMEVDLSELLARIGQEYQAALAQSKAA